MTTGLARGDGSLAPLFPAAAGGGGGAGAAAFLPPGIRPPRPCCSSSCRLGFALDISSCMHAGGGLGMRYVRDRS